jgi:hypothetical protein
MFLLGKALDQIFEQETPTGTVDGSNDTFTLSSTPHSNKSVSVFLNGLMLRQGIHYTVSGSTITFAGPPSLGQEVYVFYVKR